MSAPFGGHGKTRISGCSWNHAQAALDILWMSYGYDSKYSMDMTVDIHEISPADLFVLPRGYPMDIHMDILWIHFQFINK